MGKKLINIMITLGLALIGTIQMDLCTHIHTSGCLNEADRYAECVHIHNEECAQKITTYGDSYGED